MKTDAPAHSFLTLPVPNKADGSPRRTGVEIEFGNLDEDRAAQVVAETLGGRTEQSDRHDFKVVGTEIGDIKLYLDTALRKKADTRIEDLGLDIGRTVIPVEIVTEPLADLQPLSKLLSALEHAGAKGSFSGIFYGFGIHFNPEVADLTAEAIIPTARAYAFLEDWLRDRWPIDTSRRVLPFTDTYPRRYLDALVDLDGTDLDAFMDAYLRTTPSRNRGLDVMPLLRHIDEDRFLKLAGKQTAVSARPTWHYRLPDCGIGDDRWSIEGEWNRWILVETVAQHPDMIQDMMKAWKSYHSDLFSVPRQWVQTVEGIVGDLAKDVLDV